MYKVVQQKNRSDEKSKIFVTIRNNTIYDNIQGTSCHVQTSGMMTLLSAL